jgi:hypothetical protein
MPVFASAATDFCTEVYSYQTRDASDPRNMLVLCTGQGASVQQDVPGRGRLYHHEVEPAQGPAFGGTPQRVHRYWLEAEASRCQVGGAQEESAEEALAAVARGKTAANFVGIEAMGRRFNVQLLIQVPLAQTTPPLRSATLSQGYFGGFSFGGPSLGVGAPKAPTPAYLCGFGAGADSGAGAGFGSKSNNFGGSAESMMPPPFSFGAKSTSFGGPAEASRPSPFSFGADRGAAPAIGKSTWTGLVQRAPKRDASQHVTVTVTTYQAVEGGVPSADDVRAAIRDLCALYAACKTDRRLQDVAQAQIVSQTSSGIVHVPTALFAPAPTPAPAFGAAFPRDEMVTA